jgi:hypothetical protein
MSKAPVITKGYRGMEDRGKAGSDGNPISTHELYKIAPEAGQRATLDTHITLQSSKSGRIVQLTAPADRVDPSTGTRIKAKPLVLNFASGSGFIRLDLAKEEDRRKWIRIVGSEQAEADFEALGLKHKPAPEDGTDPIEKHPRYSLGNPMGFWNVADSRAQALKARRTQILDMIAGDPEMESFVTTVSPKDFTAMLAKRRAAKKGKAPSQVAAPDEDPVLQAKAPVDEGEPDETPEPEPEPEPGPEPAPVKKVTVRKSAAKK